MSQQHNQQTRELINAEKTSPINTTAQLKGTHSSIEPAFKLGPSLHSNEQSISSVLWPSSSCCLVKIASIQSNHQNGNKNRHSCIQKVQNRPSSTDGTVERKYSVCVWLFPQKKGWWGRSDNSLPACHIPLFFFCKWRLDTWAPIPLSNSKPQISSQWFRELRWLWISVLWWTASEFVFLTASSIIPWTGSNNHCENV